MIKNDLLCRGLWMVIGVPVANHMATLRHMSKATCKKWLKAEYHAMLKRTDDIKGSPLRFNLIWGCVMLSLPRVFPDLTPEEFVSCLHLQFSNQKRLEQMRKNLDAFGDGKKSAKPAAHESALKNDWVYTTDETDMPLEQRRVFTRCGLHALCRQEGLLEWLPHFCKLDYIMYTGFHTELVRTQTLASGDEACCFRFINTSKQSVEELMRREGIRQGELI